MTETTAIRPEEFALHAAALRRLAHNLLRCPAAAEDAVQETWIRATRGPRPALTRLGAWLRTVLQNVVVSQHRSDTRRSRREQETARRTPPERSSETDSALDLLARRETLQRVIRAIGKLSDELQTVVFLRYFDEVPPREIAAQLGIPVSVVHKRLRSAHAQLRKILDAMSPDRDWRAGLAGLFGLPSAQAPFWTPLFEGVASKMTLTKIGVAVVAAAAVSLPAILYFTKDAPPEVKTAGVQEDAAAADRQVADAQALAQSPDRQTVETDSAAAPNALLAREPHEFQLDVYASSSVDLPAQGVRVLAGPDAHALNLVGTTDRDGKLTFKWRGAKPEMDIVFGDAGINGMLQRVRVVAGEPMQVGLRQLGRGQAQARTLFITAEGGHSMLWRAPSEYAEAIEEEDGFSRWVSPTLTAKETVEVAESAETGFDGVFGYAAELDDAEKGSITITVRNAAGELQPKATVIAYAASGRIARRMQTDEAGVAEFDLPPGEHQFRAGGGDFGLAFETFELIAGARSNWEARLDRGHELVGQLVDAAGEPLAGWTVRAFSGDAQTGAWIDMTKTDAEGRYSIPNVPDRAHTVQAFAALPEGKGVTPFPARTFESWPGNEARSVVTAVTESAISLQINADELQRNGLRARLTNLDSNRAFETKLAEDGSLEMKHMTAGQYRLEIGGLGARWYEVTRFQIASKAEHDLGTVVIEPVGRAAIGKGDIAWLGRVRPDVISRVVEGDGMREPVARAFNMPVIASAQMAPPGPHLELGMPRVPTGTHIVFEKPVAAEPAGEPPVAAASSGAIESGRRTEEAMKGAALSLDDVTSGEDKQIDRAYTQEFITHYLLPAGEYVLVTPKGQVVTWTMQAGQLVELDSLLQD